MLRYMVEDSVTPGVVQGVLEADGSTTVVSWGSAGPGARPLDAASTFDIGSITKTFTATVLADMVLAGEVGLDDPMGRYLPDSVTVPTRGGAEITLRDLATHRSGFPRMGHRPANMATPYTDFTEEMAYAFLDTVELRSVPGSEYRYSNVGFNVLAFVLGRAVGIPYPDLLRERVLAPLGMDRTGYGPEGEVAELAVWGHERRGVRAYHEARGDAAYGAGGLYSNAGDLLTYLRAQVTPAETRLQRAMALTREIHGATSDHEYSLGWMRAALGQRRVYLHGGATRGFSTMAVFDPSRGIAAVTLANVSGLDRTISPSLVAPGPVPESWAVVDVDPSVLARYAGRYERDDGETSYFVRLEPDSVLTYQPIGMPRVRLYPTSDTTFFLRRSPWSFTFRTTDDGVAVQMFIDQRGPAESTSVRAHKVSDEVFDPVEVAGGSWLEPAEGPGTLGFLALGALVAGVLWFAMIRPRLGARRMH